MSSSEFWTMWSALATTGGAIATFGAVVVALWQSRLQNRKRLEVTHTFSQTLPDGKHYLSIIVSNRGNREVILNHFSWKYNDGSSIYAPYQLCIFATNGQTVSFPYKLPLENSVNILCPIELVKKELKRAIDNNLITEFDKLKIFVVDSLGDIFYAKTKLDVHNILSK